MEDISVEVTCEGAFSRQGGRGGAGDQPVPHRAASGSGSVRSPGFPGDQRPQKPNDARQLGNGLRIKKVPLQTCPNSGPAGLRTGMMLYTGFSVALAAVLPIGGAR